MLTATPRRKQLLTSPLQDSPQRSQRFKHRSNFKQRMRYGLHFLNNLTDGFLPSRAWIIETIPGRCSNLSAVNIKG